MSSKNQSTPIDHNNVMMKKIKNILDMEKLCDVMLIAGVDGKRILTNRLILAAASDYFAAMFMGGMEEATKKEITIQDIDGKMLQTLITYCYTGELNLREDNVKMIFSSAQFLLFNSVVDQCTEFLEKHLSLSNCLGIRYFAEQYNCPKIQYRAQNYICEYIYQVTKTDEFFKLSVDHLGDLLACDDLNVGLEEDIFRFLMSWVQHDETNRKQNIPMLLPNIRLPLMDSKFIADHVKDICMANGCSELYQNAIGSQSKVLKPRCWSGGCFLASTVDEFIKYCTKSSQWTSIKAIPWKSYDEIIVWKEKLVIISNLVSPTSVSYYDVELKSWRALCPLNNKIARLVVLGESLYALSGYDNNVYRLDSLTSSWQNVAPCPRTLSDITAAAFDGCIYLEGKSLSVLHLLKYNPNTDQWTDLDSWSIWEEDSSTIFVIRDNLYRFTQINIKLYNKEMNSWTKKQIVGSFFVVNNRFFAIDFKDDFILFKEYKPEKNIWINLAQRPLNEITTGCVYIPPTLSNYIM